MGTRLFIGNLSYNVNEQELREAFAGEAIEVRSVRVALDRETGRPRGFAFVETATDEGAKASIEKLSGRLMQGRPIIIEEAQAKPTGGLRPGPAAPGIGPAIPGGPPRVGGGFGPPRAPGAPPVAGGAPGGPPRGGGFGPSRPPGAPAPPRGGFGQPRGPGFGGPGAGSFDPRFQGGGAPPRAAGDAPRRERPEKKKSTRPKAEDRERGNWRWNGKVDED
jgi:cold-inducible RNA-binding protein